jgi:hypothetical protein
LSGSSNCRGRCQSKLEIEPSLSYITGQVVATSKIFHFREL